MADWYFVIEGQPISWNAAYEIGMVPRTRGGRARRGRGGVDEARTIIKTSAAKAYTQLVAARCREAKPREGWWSGGLVVVEFHYYLGRDIDCDNVMKLVGDGIEDATGVNDRWFLPRAMTKVTGLRESSRRMVIILRDPVSPVAPSASPSSAPASSAASPGPSTST